MSNKQDHTWDHRERCGLAMLAGTGAVQHLQRTGNCPVQQLLWQLRVPA
jgi:hypothetical protein